MVLTIHYQKQLQINFYTLAIKLSNLLLHQVVTLLIDLLTAITLVLLLFNPEMMEENILLDM